MKTLTANSAEIFLYQTIGDSTAEAFIRELRELQETSPAIRLRINCAGGNVFQGMSMYNAIRSSKVPVDVYVDGLAASMGSAIMLAGHKVYCASNARVMIHGPQGGDFTTAENLQIIVEIMKGIRSDLARIYSKKTGKTEQWVLDNWLMDGRDHWFTAEEAKVAGLVDEVYEVQTGSPDASWSLGRIAAFYDSSLISSMSLPDEFKFRAETGTLEVLRKENFEHFKKVFKAGVGKEFVGTPPSGPVTGYESPSAAAQLKAEFESRVHADTLEELRKSDLEHFKKVYKAGVGHEYRG